MLLGGLSVLVGQLTVQWHVPVLLQGCADWYLMGLIARFKGNPKLYAKY